MEKEEFRPVAGYEGRYEVSSEGYVVDLLNRTRIFREEYVGLKDSSGKWSSFPLKRVVCDSFSKEHSRCIYHIDGNTKNNRMNNLYASRKMLGHIDFPVRCSDGFDYKTLIEAHIITGVPIPTIRKMATGKSKMRTFKGFSFEPVDEQNADFDWRDGYYMVEHDGRYDEYPEFEGKWRKTMGTKR